MLQDSYMLMGLSLLFWVVACWFTRDRLRSRLGGTLSKRSAHFSPSFSTTVAFYFVSAFFVFWVAGAVSLILSKSSLIIRMLVLVAHPAVAFAIGSYFLDERGDGA